MNEYDNLRVVFANGNVLTFEGKTVQAIVDKQGHLNIFGEESHLYVAGHWIELHGTPVTIPVH